ncbi:MAG: AAA family ATPase [Clostridia bacterium]|nr:AAA family ATPase [Clostridia bacterium]
MQTFLEFVNNRNIERQEEKTFLEAFKEVDMLEAMELLRSLFDKKIPGQVVLWNTPFDIKVDKQKMNSYRFAVIDPLNIENGFICIWAINFLKSGDTEIPYSIDFFAGNEIYNLLWNEEGKYKSNMTIYTMGSSIAYFIPVICKIVSTLDFSLSDTDIKNNANTIFSSNVKESELWIGAAKYKVYENMSKSMIENTYRIACGYVNEKIQSNDPEFNSLRWKKKAELDKAYQNRNDGPEAKEYYKKLDSQYKEILNVMRGNGNITDLSFSVERNVQITDDNENINTNVVDFSKKKEDPEVAFKKMQIYVKSVIAGMQPGVILCGAPGIGKTYRVKQQLKANGYTEGHNLYTIKGNESPRQLYMDLYEYRHKGNIIIIDDADALVGAKAPEVSINILKAALDSTSDDEGRLVTYKVTGDLKDEEGTPIPKRMYFNAAVIIITNYSIGQLDTALRGRVFTQSLDFDSEQILGIIKKLLPAIDPVHLTTNAKMKAYDYLVKLSKQKDISIEISIRSFVSCSRLYQLCEGEGLNESQINEMIEEQMQNQALRGGRKY